MSSPSPLSFSTSVSPLPPASGPPPWCKQTIRCSSLISRFFLTPSWSCWQPAHSRLIVRLLYFPFLPPSHYSDAVYEPLHPSTQPLESNSEPAEIVCRLYLRLPVFRSSLLLSPNTLNIIISPQLQYGRVFFSVFFCRAVRADHISNISKISNVLNKGFRVKCNSHKCCICVSWSQTFVVLSLTAWDTLSQLVAALPRSRFDPSAPFHPVHWTVRFWLMMMCLPHQYLLCWGFHSLIHIEGRNSVSWCAGSTLK